MLDEFPRVDKVNPKIEDNFKSVYKKDQLSQTAGDPERFKLSRISYENYTV